jgi:hypothetical protein
MIALPYPDKALWPNGRAHYMAKAREAKKHKTWAYNATRAAAVRLGDSPIPVSLVVYPKRTGPAPDADNCIAAAKSYLDGIADALGINDRHFAAPTVTISPERTGQFIFHIGEGDKP